MTWRCAVSDFFSQMSYFTVDKQRLVTIVLGEIIIKEENNNYLKKMVCCFQKFQTNGKLFLQMQYLKHFCYVGGGGVEFAVSFYQAD